MIKVQLVVVQGKPEGKAIPLTGPVFRIGRDPTCQLRPSSAEVSRLHTEFALGADAVTVQDLGSRNGTILNGRQVTEPTVLKSGDLVKVGPLTFAVSIQGAPAAAVPAKSPAQPASLDEVSAQDVESWLIADDRRPVPDRPSGVYDGDTVMMDTLKATRPKSEPALASAAPTKPAEPAPPPAPKPAPPPAAKPAAAESAPPSPPPMSSIPIGMRGLTTKPKSFMDELDNIEYLPEGEGDADKETTYQDDSDDLGADDSDGPANAPADEMPEEWVDESNPFYAAKKKAQEAGSGEPEKPSYKDSSEAANAILRKMIERRKGGGG